MKAPRRNIWSYRVLRLVAYDRCRVASLWFAWRYGRNNAAYLRRLACLIEQNHFVNVRTWECCVAAVLHLPLAVVQSWFALRRHGAGLRSAYEVSRPSQLARMLWLAWRHGIRPQTYYYLRLHRQPLHQAALYLDPAELHHLQRAITTAPTDRIEDKLEFHRAAAAADLPVTPLIAIFSHGRMESSPLTSLFADWEQNLIVKPTNGYSSAGLRGFRFHQGHYTCATTGQVFTLPELERELLSTSADQVLLVQPWLRNSSRIAGFSTSALCNFRVVTGRSPAGRCEILMAALRFPIRSELTCAEANVTLCAAVDFATGALSAAEAKDPAVGRLDTHPMTGQQIEGHVIASWPDIRALALRAHEAFPEFPFIGWDIVDSDHGLLLLEGSTLWGGNLAQMSGSAPLGGSRFAELYLENLYAINAGQPTPASVTVSS